MLFLEKDHPGFRGPQGRRQDHRDHARSQTDEHGLEEGGFLVAVAVPLLAVLVQVEENCVGN